MSSRAARSPVGIDLPMASTEHFGRRRSMTGTAQPEVDSGAAVA